MDPNYRVCSTRNVPPQQESWWTGVDTRPDSGSGAPDGTIAGSEVADGLMSLEEAKTLRLELMAERKRENIESRLETYDFCEH